MCPEDIYPRWLHRLSFWLLAALVLVVGYAALADAAPPLETQIEMTIDAFKIGSFGTIIFAVVQLLKHPFVVKWVTGPILRLAHVQLEPVAPSQIPPGANPMLADTRITTIPGKATPALTLGVGMLGSVLHGVATGQKLPQAIAEGAFASGAAMAIFDLILKPFKKK